ncbi:RNA-dependent RNA polymerase 1 [Tolypocladium paradoxum]|uniref:RNA-dependent RNA polymerase n=1 Tax=Tolypocladium paradoxum TaxID=94208 RepID=A0A2S4KQW7_9HYPO|nr:RNA-dependent RNA polymerase 1 [Tolypocladium paradoxum]
MSGKRGARRPATPRKAKSPLQDKNKTPTAPAKPKGTPLKPKSTPPRPNQSPRSISESPRAEWRKWSELSVRLDGLPLDVTTEQLWGWFSPEGAIVWMDIFDQVKGRSTVSARIRFEPPPKRAFWSGGSFKVQHPSTRHFPNGLTIQSTLLREAPRRRLINSNTSHQREYPIKMTVGLQQLDFGSMVGPTAMQVLKSVTASSGAEELELELDVRAKRLTVYFPIVTKTEEWCGTRPFCFVVDLSNVKNMYEAWSADGTIALVLPLPRPPQYFWRMGDVQSTFLNDIQSWSISDVWHRATDIAQDFNAPMQYPVAVHNDIKDPGYIEIGRWTTFRLVLGGHAQRENDAPLQQVREALEDFNVSVQRCDDFDVQKGSQAMWDYLDHPPIVASRQASALLEMDASPIIHLAFEVRYQLEVCVSRGILNENTVGVEFLQRLAALKPFDATRRLEYLVDQGEALYDPMALFASSDAESYVPNVKSPHYCTLVRKAVITPTTIRYNSPTVETSNRVVRKYNHMQDRFLRVQFIEEAEQGRISINKKQNDDIWKRILRALYQGIRIGDRIYEFLGFGSSQLRQCGVYFFCPTEHTSCDDIRQWMGEFNHIKVVAKYAARLGQCFSTTREIRGIFKPDIKVIPDIERGGHCFTDGVGKISQFLARLIIEEMTLDVFDEPTAFQFRMGGCKGVLTVWPQAQGMEVHVRESQAKFKAISNGLEIIRCAKFSTATLNRQTITILECLGVPPSAFLKLLDQQIKEYQAAMMDNSVAVGLLTKFVDENQSTLVLAELLKAGFKSSEIQEPFTLNLVNLWRSWSLKLLKEKARIQIAKSAFVLGCVDETGTLRGHSAATEGSPDKDVNKLPQIFLQLTDPTRYDQTITIKGICIVGRNPSLHPGDIRVVQAVDNPKLRHLKDVVVFPSTGDRPVPNMLSGGDLDGDDFFVIWDPDLIPKEWNCPPMNYAAPKPLKLARDVNVNDIRDFFVKYLKNDVLPLIATAHLALSDEHGPKSQLCRYLAEMHSKAVDYPKTGDPAEFSVKLQPRKWPHFMEKRNSYKSTKALGQIFDKVVKQTVQFLPDWEHAFDQRIISRFELDNDTLKAARKIKSQYDISVRRILAQHDVATEFELYTGWAMSRPAIGSDYKRQEDLGREYDALMSRFRELCYDAVGGSDPDKLDRFVAAMYTVTEKEIKIALFEHHRGPTNEAGKIIPQRRLEPKSMPLISFPWIFHWVLIRIATGSKYQPKKSHLAAARRRTLGVIVNPRAQSPRPAATNGEVAHSVAKPHGGTLAASVADSGAVNGEELLVFDENEKPTGENSSCALKTLAEGCGERQILADMQGIKMEALDDEQQGEAAADEAEGENAMDRLAALMGFDNE